ncbi:MAG TPA: hypothetical protein VFN00_09465 [Arthrobacter sp.]|nr:hypothetical protein [Arthrobacter sp.]
MTQPAVHLPVDPSDSGSGTGGSPVRSRRGFTLPWKGLLIIAAAGIPAGLLWWLLAPTGLNLISRDPALASGSNPSTWLPRDLVLAGLFLLAGCLSGILIAGSKPASLPALTVVAAVAAAAAGALLAWGTGLLAGNLFTPAHDTSASASIAFSLRAYAVLLVWPAATALSIFVATLFGHPEPAPDAGPSPR